MWIRETVDEPKVQKNDETTVAIFPGDMGTLTFSQRQVLICLLKGPYFTRESRPNLWNELLKSRFEIERALHNVLLTLVLDEDDGLAFCRQAPIDDEDAPSLLRSLGLKFLDSVILLEMRRILLMQQTSNDKAFISEQTIEETLRLFDTTSRTNEVLFRNRLNAVIKRLTTRKLLLKFQNQIGIYEISPILKLIFNAEEVEQLKRSYEQRQSLSDDNDVEDEE